LDDSGITKESINNSNNGLKPSAEKEEDRFSYANLINEGILAGQKIAKLSIVTLVSIGIV